MSPPEMRQTQSILVSTLRPSLSRTSTMDRTCVPTERTALLTKNEVDKREVSPAPSETHFRNIDGRHFWLLFGSIIFGSTIAFFDSTLMASAHPVITSYFGASNSASWLSTAFSLASTVSQPLYARLSDTVGRKPVYLFAQTMFLLSTIWCALATNIGSFIAARAICGMGAGGVMSVSNIITSDVVKIEYRGIYQSYYNMAYGIGNGLGAAFGGMLCDSLGWRWAFGIQVPFIIIFITTSFLVTPTNLGPNLAASQGKTFWAAFDTFDTSGSIVLIVTITCFILGLNLGGNVLSWTHPFVLTTLLLCVVGAFTIIPISRRAARPVLPLHLLAKSPNANLMWASLFFSICLNIVLFNVPLFLQAVRLTSPTVSGLYLILPLVGVALTAIATGWYIALTRRMQPPLILGQIMLIAGVVGTTCLNQHLPVWAMLLLVPWVNIGQGFYFPTCTIATLSLNTVDDQAVVVSTLGLFRSLGSILGVAVSSWVLQNSLPFYLEKEVTDVDPAVKERIVQAVRKSVQAIKGLDAVHKKEVVHAYAQAMRMTFAMGLIFATMVIVLSWPVRLPMLMSQDEKDAAEEQQEAREREEGEDVVVGEYWDDETDDDEEDFVGRGGAVMGSSAVLSRQSTRTVGTMGSRRASMATLDREASRLALQLGKKASFDTTF